MVTSRCEICGAEITRGGSKPGRFCSRACAAEHRRTWKPVTRDWLYQQYVVEELGTVQIGRLVGRHPKRVYEWLVNLGIPLREKWRGNVPKHALHRDPEWLKMEYESGLSLADVAEKADISSSTVLKYLKKHGISVRGSSETKKIKGIPAGCPGERNGMHGRKGPLSSNWKGGITPERQAFYETREWAEACLSVWRRDDATCRRCGTRKTDGSQEFCVHHVVSFAVRELRAEPSNLILLCKKCHLWVHSRRNKDREFIADHLRV